MYSAVITIINKKGYKANYREIVKDGVKRKAIEIGYPDMNIRTMIYVDAIPGADNMAYEELAEKIIEIANANKPTKDIDLTFVTDWSKVKENVIACIRPVVEDNDTITKDYLDLQVYFRIIIPSPGECDDLATITVRHDLFDKWGITVDELCNAAYDNCLNKTVIMSLSSIVQDMDPDMLIPQTTEMTVVSNKMKRFGAIAMTMTDTLRDLHKRIGQNFYILPSSIHEILVVPETIAPNGADELKMMVASVNDTEVAPNEILSYSVYYYDGALLQIA